MTTSVGEFFGEVRPAIDQALSALMPDADQCPPVLAEAMRYSVFAGGKRLRPALCIAAYRAFRDDWPRVLSVAASFELIHTYSLIHDDLPSMDDDDFRRGIPSCHRKFGEAVAILAGDALLTLAFETISRCDEFAPERILGASAMLGAAAGSSKGMIAGQILDLEAEGVSVGGDELESIHRYKTGAMLEASIEVGAYLSGAADGEMDPIGVYGRKIGLAFQIVDDILDETVSGDALSKTPGKDRKQQKATYPALHGIDASRQMVGRLTAAARDSTRALGPRAWLLRDIADYLESRSN